MACGKGKIPDQTIVTGDSFEITLPELEQVLRAAPPVRREEVAPARRALLNALIGQKLLAEAADKEKLDERPEVVQQIAAARRAILANAYVRKIGKDDEKIPDSEILRYYEGHPGLFKDRLEFTVDEFALPLADARLSAYTKILNDRGFDALKSALAERMPDVAVVSRTLASSDLPAEIGNAAARLKPGSDVAYRTATALHLGRVVSVQPKPMPLESARDAIVGLIAQERRQTLVAAAVEDLKRTRHVRIVNADLSKMAAK